MKIKDITPQTFICVAGCCPSVFETDREIYLIVGHKVEYAERFLPGKIGPDETAIEVPVGLIREIKTA